MHSFNALIKKNSLLIRAAALLLVGVVTVLLLSQTVFAKTTYVITDGDQVTVHTTFETDPVEILGEAGLQISEEDIIETLPGEEEGTSAITVIRGQNVVIDYCGDKTEIVSYGETVQELFDRLGISVREESEVSAQMDSVTYEGMEIAISTNAEVVEDYTVAVPFETVYQETGLLAAGTEVVLTQGVEGQQQITAEVTYVNGKETDRFILSEEIVTEPVTQVVAVGTGEGPAKDGEHIIGDGVIITSSGEVVTFSHRKTFTATAYCRIEEGGQITSTGTPTRVGAIAVDPRVIPYGTRMFIVTKDGAYVYGVATAEDCGGSIKGTRLDLFYETMSECVIFGVRDCDVYFLN